MATPPCELAQGLKPMTTKTLVAKSTGGISRLLSEWAASRVVDGAGAYAVVDMPIGGIYVVICMAKAARTEYAAANMKASIEQLPGSPQVDWVRPMTRRLQRLFGWGDAGATGADVARAVDGADVEELAVLIPQAADMIMRNAVDWKHLPALHSVSQCAPIAGLAIEDRSARLALQDHADIEEEDDNTIPLRVVHEAFDQHVWSERTNRKAQCEHCKGWDPYECDCGARLCGLCRLPPAVGTKPTCKWQQHPTRPLPFSVQDHVKWPDEEKLAWIRQELGEGAELEDFAKKWRELFGDKIRGEVPQKAACIKLYGMYAPPEEGRAWRNESDLPPETLEPFQRIWDVNAPDVVWGCRYVLGTFAPRLCHGLRLPPLIPATPPILRPQPPSPHSRDPSDFAAAARLLAFRGPLPYCVPGLPPRIPGDPSDLAAAAGLRASWGTPRILRPQRLCAHPGFRARPTARDATSGAVRAT